MEKDTNYFRRVYYKFVQLVKLLNSRTCKDLGTVLGFMLTNVRQIFGLLIIITCLTCVGLCFSFFFATSRHRLHHSNALSRRVLCFSFSHNYPDGGCIFLPRYFLMQVVVSKDNRQAGRQEGRPGIARYRYKRPPGILILDYLTQGPE